MAQTPTYWKQFADWVTGYVNKYRSDIFFRTECNIIGLQVFFVCFVLILVVFSFNYLFHDVTLTIITQITNQLVSGNTTNTFSNGFEYLKTKNFIPVIILIIILTAIFGYLVSFITLRPARKSLRVQKQFLRNIAHELRTPLAIIKTNLEVSLMQNNLKENHIREVSKSNIEELDRISYTIDNLVTFNALTRPENFRFEQVDLSKIVELTLKKLSKLIEKKHTILKVKKDDFTIIEGKASAIEQITTNILKNALIYTPEGGTIIIYIESIYPDYVELRVEDNGSGISKEDIFHIFEPFYRADPSRTRQNSGSGLGLTIVQELVKLHNGQIFIKSKLKHGTSVIVRFPFSKINEPLQNAFMKL